MTLAVYAIATMDTKGEELAYVALCMRNAGVTVKMVDVGTLAPPTVTPDVSRDQVLGGKTLPAGDDRGTGERGPHRVGLQLR